MGKVSRHIPVRLGRKLKKIREELGFSQTEMLEEIRLELELPKHGILKRLEIFSENKLTRSSISGYELGTRMPPYYVLMAYAEAANVYLEVLYDDTVELDPYENIPYEKKSEGLYNLCIPPLDNDDAESVSEEELEQKQNANKLKRYLESLPKSKTK